MARLPASELHHRLRLRDAVAPALLRRRDRARAKYDLVNRAGLRGVGIWALGYDGTRPELYATLKAKFITDKVPPTISGATISTPIISPNGDGRLDTTTVKVAVTGHLSFGWQVQPIVAGVARAVLRSGSLASKNVTFTWDGRPTPAAWCQ